MKKFVKTIKNIWAIEDLRTRILITLGFAAIYRLGSFIVLPGVNPEGLQQLANQTSEGLMSLLNMFSGGAFSNASIFALGIMPYISASIVIQLLTVVVPYFQKMQREGESGHRKINQYTRYLTIFVLLFQGPFYLMNLYHQAGNAIVVDSTTFYISSTIILAAGSMFVLWLGERITDRGIGNGVSLIIMLGIIARLPQAFGQEVVSRLTALSGGGLVMFLIEIVLLFGVVLAAILLVQGTRRVPVQYAQRMVRGQQVGGARQYIPLKLFAANVMPIIFALLIIAFTYFYTAITMNPVQMAEDIKRNNGFIPGVRPGKDTADYLDNAMTHLMVPGSIFLAILACMPAFTGLLNVTPEFAHFFGGTSLLILVGVVLDTLQQIESHLLMRHYDGLMDSGRIHGRNIGTVAAY